MLTAAEETLKALAQERGHNSPGEDQGDEPHRGSTHS